MSDNNSEYGPAHPGVSEEVIRHHGREHVRLSPRCKGAPAGEMICDHGTTLLIVCRGCGQPVFCGVFPGTWCEHAQEMVVGA